MWKYWQPITRQTPVAITVNCAAPSNNINFFNNCLSKNNYTLWRSKMNRTTYFSAVFEGFSEANHYLNVFFSTQVLYNWCSKCIWTFDHTFISIKICFNAFYRNVLHFYTFLFTLHHFTPEKRLLWGRAFSSILPVFQLKGALPSRNRMRLSL